MMPSSRLLWLSLIWVLVAVCAAIWPQAERPWLLLTASLGGLALIDLLWLRATPNPSVERRLMHTLAVGVWRNVTLIFHHQGRRGLRMQVFDHYPTSGSAEGLPVSLYLAPRKRARVRYRFRPEQRGDFQFSTCQIRLQSPIGLWQQQRRIGEATEVRVYPNFATVMKYTLLATDHRLSMMGIKKRRRRGQGLEFHQLREYREGDSLRQVDWRATSRVRRLISRDYQDERDQQVLFMIDCGRRMRSEDGHISHFDESLNSVLLLSHVALRQGDAVGALTFAGEERLLAPMKGGNALNRLLNGIFDLQPSTDEPDYLDAARKLLRLERKRSLVVVITNLRDEDMHELLPAVGMLRKRHLVVVASLRERVVDDVLEAPVKDYEHALEKAAAHQYVETRGKLYQRLNASGVRVLDVTPGELPVRMVNTYLDIKGSGVL